MEDLWLPLGDDDASPDDLYCELYRELADSLVIKPEDGKFASVVADSELAKEVFMSVRSSEIAGERSLIKFMDSVWNLLDEDFGEEVAQVYKQYLLQFIDRYNLRYGVDQRGRLYPSMEALFSGSLMELRIATESDPHLWSLMDDIDQSLADLSAGETDSRIRTCIQKQMNFLEALGKSHPESKAGTLGRICDEVNSWPHAKVREALKSLYTFASDYPGIRHGGTPGSAIRVMDMRDMISLSVCILSLSPYLNSSFNAESVYKGVWPPSR